MITANRRHPSATAQELTGRDYISYSAMTTFQQCPLKYYFKYVAGLPEAKVGSALVFGGAIHSAVEFHFHELLAGGGPPSLDALVDVYGQAWNERDQESVRFGRDGDAETLGKMAKRMLATFRTSDFSAPRGTILGIEEELRGEVVPGCPDLLARVDLLIDNGDELVISDLKTSRSRWSREHADDSAEQLVLYAELVRQLVPGKSVRLEFAVVTKGSVPVLDRHVVAIEPGRAERTKRVLAYVWKAIESRHFYPAPSPMNCPSCPFREPCGAWRG